MDGLLVIAGLDCGRADTDGTETELLLCDWTVGRDTELGGCGARAAGAGVGAGLGAGAGAACCCEFSREEAERLSFLANAGSAKKIKAEASIKNANLNLRCNNGLNMIRSFQSKC